MATATCARLVICNFWHPVTLTLSPECPDVKNYKWRLDPVLHNRMLYSCTDTTTVGVKGLRCQACLSVCLLERADSRVERLPWQRRQQLQRRRRRCDRDNTVKSMDRRLLGTRTSHSVDCSDLHIQHHTSRLSLFTVTPWWHVVMATRWLLRKTSYSQWMNECDNNNNYKLNPLKPTVVIWVQL